MEFSGVTKDIASRSAAIIGGILALDISPIAKQEQIVYVLLQTGTAFHNHLFGAVSRVFGSETMTSTGLDDPNDQRSRIANKLVRNYALSRPTNEIVTSYFYTVLARAQAEAFANARSMQLVPTLTRTVVGETCAWCDSKAGSYTNPQGEDFARHRDCDCLIEVSGFNTRNGILNNYVKG